MSLRNKLNRRNLFILLYGAIFIFFVVPYVIHLSNLAAAASSIAIRESREQNRLNTKRDQLKASFLSQFPEEQALYDRMFDPLYARISRDTIISLFIYYNSLRINSYDLNYANCTSSRIYSEAKRLKADKEFEQQLNELEKKHGSRARIWANKIGKRRFFEQYKTYDCDPYFKGIVEYDLDKNAFIDFDRFLNELTISEEQTKQDSYRLESEYKERIQQLKDGLSQKAKKLIDRQLENNQALRDGYRDFKFESASLGNFEYTIPSKVIDEKTLEDAMDIVYNELYRNNSLANGSMPYAYCYGRNNFGNSSVRVNAGNIDALVMIKNTSNRVIRHAYVKANRGFTLHVPNGTYTVHFYHGTGWNPKKRMKDTHCGPIMGGFIYFESISKDPERLYLYNQSMSYTLRRVTGGNFSTVPSSVSEAF